MKIRVLYFAAIRELMNRSEDTIEVAPGATAASLARQLIGSDATLLFAVNDELVSRDYELDDDDQLAFIPPMAGG